MFPLILISSVLIISVRDRFDEAAVRAAADESEFAAMRHDLRHSYRLIFMMLETGKVEEARQFIARQEKLIGGTKVQTFCVQPLINVALLIYVRRAESFGIKVQHKVNLPENIGVDESDLALLISNLLENAINASVRQPKNRRAISIKIQNVGGQFVLEISNHAAFSK